MNLPFYYAKEPQKDKILDSFLTNNTVFTIFATSALSLGVDFNIVKFILYISPYYVLGLIKYI